MAATHGYRSREKRKMGIPEKDKYVEDEIDKILAFGMKLERIGIRK